MNDGAVFAAVILFVIGVVLMLFGLIHVNDPCGRRDETVGRVMIVLGGLMAAPPLIRLWLLVVLS